MRQVGADGASSVVRTLLEEQGLGDVHSVALEEKRENTRVYKTIVIPLQNTEYSTPDGSGMCTLSERSEAGRVIESLPTKEGAIPVGAELSDHLSLFASTPVVPIVKLVYVCHPSSRRKPFMIPSGSTVAALCVAVAPSSKVKGLKQGA